MDHTGNTARIFFQNSKKSAEITGVDEELIKRFHIILQTISCGYEVDSERFYSYAMETAKLFVSNYPWYYMPTSVHKVLIHGADIIKHAILPIGQLGEEQRIRILNLSESTEVEKIRPNTQIKIY